MLILNVLINIGGMVNHNLAILGFGLVGKSALNFFKNNNLDIDILDNRYLDNNELLLIENSNAKYYHYSSNNQLQKLLNNYDKIFVSPGIYLNNCLTLEYKNKIICELDLFKNDFKIPNIAITGTLGKTSITSILADILSIKQKKIIKKRFFNNWISNKELLNVEIGGNIGIPILSLFDKQNKSDLNIIELSSFQLALNKSFAPDIALWTNFYANHLDWHKNLKDYFDAKCKIFEFQKSNQAFIFPIEFLNNDFKKEFLEKIHKSNSQIFIVSNNPIDLVDFKKMGLNNSSLFYVKKQLLYFIKIKNNKIVLKEIIFDLSQLSVITCRQNWLFIIAGLYLLNLDLNILKKFLINFIPKNKRELEHRLEYFTTINDVDFYDDSKSTVIQATQNAIKELNRKNRPIILILGGLSKGVNRKPLINFLQKIQNLKKVFCLGNNLLDFENFESYSSIADLINAIFKNMMPGDIVLFSPSGTSFDLFKNYKDRGKIFKKAVLENKF